MLPPGVLQTLSPACTRAFLSLVAGSVRRRRAARGLRRGVVWRARPARQRAVRGEVVLVAEHRPVRALVATAVPAGCANLAEEGANCEMRCGVREASLDYVFQVRALDGGTGADVSSHSCTQVLSAQSLLLTSQVPQVLRQYFFAPPSPYSQTSKSTESGLQ